MAYCGLVRASPNDEIGQRCRVDSDAVLRWRSRFIAEGIAGVGKIAKGRGRRPSLPAGTVAEVLRLTYRALPADGFTHWSTRAMAARVGIGCHLMCTKSSDQVVRSTDIVVL